MDEGYAINQLAKSECASKLGYPDAIHVPTVGQNIERQIQIHRDAITRLEATRASLDKANLLDLKISDLREAMNY